MEFALLLFKNFHRLQAEIEQRNDLNVDIESITDLLALSKAETIRLRLERDYESQWKELLEDRQRLRTELQDVQARLNDGWKKIEYEREILFRERDDFQSMYAREREELARRHQQLFTEMETVDLREKAFRARIEKENAVLYRMINERLTGDQGLPRTGNLKEIQSALIRCALLFSDGDLEAAASVLGLSVKEFRRRMGR